MGMGLGQVGVVSVAAMLVYGVAAFSIGHVFPFSPFSMFSRVNSGGSGGGALQHSHVVSDALRIVQPGLDPWFLSYRDTDLRGIGVQCDSLAYNAYRHSPRLTDACTDVTAMFQDDGWQPWAAPASASLLMKNVCAADAAFDRVRIVSVIDQHGVTAWSCPLAPCHRIQRDRDHYRNGNGNGLGTHGQGQGQGRERHVHNDDASSFECTQPWDGWLHPTLWGRLVPVLLTAAAFWHSIVSGGITVDTARKGIAAAVAVQVFAFLLQLVEREGVALVGVVPASEAALMVVFPVLVAGCVATAAYCWAQRGGLTALWAVPALILFCALVVMWNYRMALVAAVHLGDAMDQHLVKEFFSLGPALYGWLCGALYARYVVRARHAAAVDACGARVACACMGMVYVNAMIAKSINTGVGTLGRDTFWLREIVASKGVLQFMSASPSPPQRMLLWLVQVIMAAPVLSQQLTVAALAVQAGGVLLAVPSMRRVAGGLLLLFHLGNHLLTGIWFMPAPLLLWLLMSTKHEHKRHAVVPVDDHGHSHSRLHLVLATAAVVAAVLWVAPAAVGGGPWACYNWACKFAPFMRSRMKAHALDNPVPWRC